LNLTRLPQVPVADDLSALTRIDATERGECTMKKKLGECLWLLVAPSAFKVGVLVVTVSLSLYILSGEEVRKTMDAIDNRIVDAMFRIRGPVPTTGQVVIADIDEKSLKELGQWPWPRTVIGDLLRKLDAADAKMIGFDVVFAEEDRLSPSKYVTALKPYFRKDAQIPEEQLDNDTAFGVAVGETNTVLGYFFQMEEDALPPGKPPFPAFMMDLTKLQDSLPDGGLQLPQAYRPVLNIGPVCSNALSEGYFNALPDFTGIVRRVPLLTNYKGSLFPHITLEMLRTARENETGEECIPTLAVGDLGIVGVQFENYMIPTDVGGQVWVNYRGPEKTFKYFSITDILHDRVDPQEIRNKYVLIGTSTWGLRDLRATPFDAAFAGVEILATVIDNILLEDPLRRDLISERAYVCTAILVAGLILSAALAYSGPIISGFAGAGFVVFLVLGNYYGFFLRHQILGVAYPIVALVAVFIMVSLANYFFEGRQKKKIRGMFQTMVSGDVLKYMQDNPGTFSLSGEERQATMFFSDVAGFTTISESLTPEKLVQLLNAYLTPMTDIVMDSQGYVDKYEGDAIMAEWGVPFALENHAQLACWAALDQQVKLAEMRQDLYERFGHRLFVRMGLNSGAVSAGNMGSTRRFSYTVMGDAVNQAARFEPANKDYDTDIMIGASTYELAKDHIEARLLDKIVVKGKTEPIEIYELIAKKGEITQEKREVVKLYGEGLETHWQRDWDGAIAKFKAGLEIDPDDGPCKALLERIEEYKEEPPPDTWQGEYVRKSKD